MGESEVSSEQDGASPEALQGVAKDRARRQTGFRDVGRHRCWWYQSRIDPMRIRSAEVKTEVVLIMKESERNGER
jgi:hypothetical protein